MAAAFCRLRPAAAEAAFKLALTPNVTAPPEQLLRALRTWNPADPRSVDDMRLDARPTYATAARKGRGQSIRQPNPNELRTRHAYFIKKLLSDALTKADAPAHIGLDTIKHVPSGLALRPSDSCSSTESFAFQDLIKETLAADRVDISNQWDRFVLMNVPCYIDGEQVPNEILAEELEAALDCPLAEPPRRLGRPEDLATQRTTSVLFSLPCGRMPAGTTRLSVLGQRFSYRLYKEQKASENCDKCLSQHHTTAACKALKPRCKACGDEGHEAQNENCRVVKAASDTVESVPFCYHCHGPHPAFSPGCYAAARYSKEVRAVTVPTGTRLARARKAGTRRRQQQLARIRIATSIRTSRTVEQQEEEDEDGLLGVDGGVEEVVEAEALIAETSEGEMEED
ncbi:hypothetical protein CF326_g7355 [Tilletia indica]|nr:hypothetical protein CF326_g7355 [Tilletia indica]